MSNFIYVHLSFLFCYICFAFPPGKLIGQGLFPGEAPTETALVLAGVSKPYNYMRSVKHLLWKSILMIFLQ